MLRSIIYKSLFAFALIISSFTTILAQESHEEHAKSEKFNVGGMIMHHIKDDHGWELAHGLTIPLPVILYTKDQGLKIFSSSAFGHDGTHDGFINEHGKIHRLGADGKVDEEAKVYDFSITKNVASLILSAVILMTVFLSVSKGYAKNRGRAPKGLQSFLEPVVVFVRDEIARPNIGPTYTKYLPYLLTLFFFILVNNLLGLLPGAANLTGNITVTLVLAVITFFIVTFSGNRHYWLHLVKPTGVPIALLPIMIPVEIVGLFMKPISLMIRLFANITAGHIVILSLLGLIFLANHMAGPSMGWAVSPVVALFALFLNVIELLVAFLQAFIFTLLTAMYIGSAVEEHHEADHGIGYEGAGHYDGPGEEIG